MFVRLVRGGKSGTAWVPNETSWVPKDGEKYLCRALDPGEGQIQRARQDTNRVFRNILR